jgi:hypothetical protein
LNPPLEDRLNTPIDPKVAAELSEKIPDFRKAFTQDGLAWDAFAPYGPVQLFRNKFLAGWDTLTAEIRKGAGRT